MLNKIEIEGYYDGSKISEKVIIISIKNISDINRTGFFKVFCFDINNKILLNLLSSCNNTSILNIKGRLQVSKFNNVWQIQIISNDINIIKESKDQPDIDLMPI